jgi:hypothetical protein
LSLARLAHISKAKPPRITLLLQFNELKSQRIDILLSLSQKNPKRNGANQVIFIVVITVYKNNGRKTLCDQDGS